MALKGLDIFKLSPKTNCKECGSPTCMAFCMKVAQGALPIEKCPHMSDEAMAKLSEATAALAVLGYSQGEINVALKGVDLEGQSLEQVIKQALKKMVKG